MNKSIELLSKLTKAQILAVIAEKVSYGFHTITQEDIDYCLFQQEQKRIQILGKENKTPDTDNKEEWGKYKDKVKEIMVAYDKNNRAYKGKKVGKS